MVRFTWLTVTVQQKVYRNSETRQDETAQDNTRQNKTAQHNTTHGWSRQEQDKTENKRQDKTGQQSTTRHGTAQDNTRQLTTQENVNTTHRSSKCNGSSAVWTTIRFICRFNIEVLVAGIHDNDGSVHTRNMFTVIMCH